MAVLLLPPKRIETSSGFLWFRKRGIEFRVSISKSNQVKGVGLGMAGALKTEFDSRKKLKNVEINFFGDFVEVTQACELFHQEIAKQPKVQKWLFEDVPLFFVNLAREEGDPFKAFAYYTENGKRECKVVMQPQAEVEASSSAPERIVPRIKNIAFKEALEQMGPQGALPVTEPLVADLLVSYAFEKGDMLEMLREEDREKMGLSHDELRALAIENIRARTDDYRLRTEGAITHVETCDDLEACLLLRDDIWPGFEESAEGELIVAVPSRNELAFVGADSKAGLKSLRAFAKRSFRNQTTHGVTEQLLVRREQSWQVFDA